MGTAEASYRTSISRAYYAAFTLAAKLAQTRDGFSLTRTGRDHNGVEKHFRDSASTKSSANRLKLADYLKTLRDNRHQADYADTLPSADSVTETTLLIARDVVNLLSSLQTQQVEGRSQNDEG
jgi:uncharacterized protein (UPF0332 family)